ncbi:MAG TPA: AAA family ATPase [Gammaproteobacteria bacterium]|nr:AAA family ATPase [Gammaproteobacteria bacterium]
MYESASQQINRGIISRYPLIYILGWEEERIEKTLAAVSAKHYFDSRAVITWTAGKGFFSGTEQISDIHEPVEAVEYISNSDKSSFYLLKDLPAFLNDNLLLERALRDLYQENKNRDIFVFISYPTLQLPDSLKKELLLVEFEQPTEEEIIAYLKEALVKYKLSDKISEEWVNQTANAMKGLGLEEIGHLLLTLLRVRKLKPEEVIIETQREKGLILKKESCLRFIPAITSLDEVGGLDNLKNWVTTRKELFSREAIASGIQPPSGILFMGVSGCGKSMASKVIASAWNVPLVRLDMNLVMSGVYGTPEYAFEQAISLAEKIAPIVLWIDEVENSFGYDEGSSGGNINIFSSFLTWMQEKPHDVFVAATANRIRMLPAEMLRKGRFDQVFFLNLPNDIERREILSIHIRAKDGNPEDFKIDILSSITEKWSGAEIESLISSASIEAYKERRDFDQKDILHVAGQMVPLSKTMEEQIRELTGWSFNRATPASKSDRPPIQMPVEEDPSIMKY